MATYFSADSHFGDAHILRTRGGAFSSVEAHDAFLVAAWNEVVGPTDDLWHVGDFAADASREHCLAIFERLNGFKRLVRGNHDTSRVLDLPWHEAPVDSLRLVVKAPDGTDLRLFLAHYPHRAWPGLWRGTRHLYGHTHARIPDTTRSCDVGVDAWSYRPVGIAALLARQDTATVLPDEIAWREAQICSTAAVPPAPPAHPARLSADAGFAIGGSGDDSASEER